MDPWSDGRLESIHRMLNPTSIAVVGATERMQYGGRFLRFALEASPRVKVYPINPRYEALMGVRCYPSLKDLPESPDVVGIVVPYHRVMDVLQDCVEMKAGSGIIISAGFAERGSDDRRDLQRQVANLAQQTGIRMAGPNCLGMANLKSNIWACSSSRSGGAIRGPIGLVSQSGASAFGPFLARAADLGIGYSYIVSTGNEADLDASDFIRYLLDDEDTRVIACFIEGLKDGRKFLEVARMAADRAKPILVIKTGRSSVGARAAMTHTAAMTGSDRVHDAAFSQYGVIRVDDYDELLETAQLMAYSKPTKKEGMALVSHSGGIASLSADKCGQMGLELPPLTMKAQAELEQVLKGFGGVGNPADVTGNANSCNFPKIMETLITEPEVGTLAIASAGGDEQARQVKRLNEGTDKSVVFLWTGSQSANDGLDKLKEAHIPIFYQPEKLAMGLSRRLAYYRWRNRHLNKLKPFPAGGFQRKVKTAQIPPLTGDGPLTEHEAKQLISSWGISVTLERQAGNVDDAVAAARQIGYPVVLKVESRDIPHKSDAGLVRVGIDNESALRLAYENIILNAHSEAPEARISGVLVQEMVTDGVEVIVGVSQDPTFGPVILCGIGGIYVEMYEDVAMRVCPIDHAEAREMVTGLRAAKLLQGYRGQPRADVDGLVDVLVRMSVLAIELQSELTQIDINPLAVLPQGQGVKVLDALVVPDR